MSTENTQNGISDNSSIEVHLNPSIQPTFSDHIFKVEVSDNNSIAKIFLAHKMENKLFHNSTIVMPLDSFLELDKLINSDKFREDLKLND